MTVDESPFSRLGGLDGLRPIIADFVQRMVHDAMIGFFFDRVDHERLVEIQIFFGLGRDPRLCAEHG